MSNFMLSGVAQQIAADTTIAIITDNIANQRVPGRQAIRPVFTEVFVAQTQASGGDAVTAHGFIARSGTSRDVSSGAFEHTGDPFNFAVSGPAYFAVRNSNGEITYTKNGKFRLNEQRQVVDSKGNMLLAEGEQPIQLTEGVKLAEFVVKEDGTMIAKDQQLGKLMLARFENQNKMDLDRNGHFHTDQPNLGPLDEDGQRIARVQQGFVEESNIQNIREMTHLLTAEKSSKRISSLMEAEQRRRMEFYSAIPGNR